MQPSWAQKRKTTDTDPCVGGSLGARGDDGREGVQGSGPWDPGQIRRRQHGRPDSGPCVLQVLLCLTLGFNRGTARPRAGRPRRGAPLSPAGDTRARPELPWAHLAPASGRKPSSVSSEQTHGRRHGPGDAPRSLLSSDKRLQVLLGGPRPRQPGSWHLVIDPSQRGGRSNQHYHLEGPWGGPRTTGSWLHGSDPAPPHPGPK